jgi:hypothetical protein
MTTSDTPTNTSLDSLMAHSPFTSDKTAQ